MERIAAERQWQEAHPEGEVRHLDTATGALLAAQLASPSLFVQERLVVVRDATLVLGGKDKGSDAAQTLLTCLASSWDLGTSLLLCAPAKSEPQGPVADFVRAHGTLTWRPLPPPPKPWEDVRISAEQRRSLEALLQRTAPQILQHRGVVDVLLDHCGFKPRLVVQTAQRLLLAGQLEAEQVRAELGPREVSLDDAEKALTQRDIRRLAVFLGALTAGTDLVTWRGERIAPAGVAAVVSQWLQRLLRQALAMREHARRCGLASELDVRRCGAPRWYQGVFQARLHPLLEKDILAAGESELAEASPWQRQRVFRMAAAYSDGELRRVLATLSRFLPEREKDAAAALVMLSQALLSLVSAAPAAGDTILGG